MRGICLRTIFIAALCAQISFARNVVKRQTSSSSTAVTSDPIEFLAALSNILSGATNAVNTILDIKQNSVAPAVEAVVKAGDTIMKSPIVKTLGKQGDKFVQDLTKNGPALTRTATNLASVGGEATTGLVKAAICNLVCPFQEKPAACKKENKCGEKEEDSSEEEIDYEEGGDYIRSS